MAVTVEKIENEPIIIATYSDDLTLDDIKQVYEFTARYVDTVAGQVYRINDIRDAEVDFPTAMSIIKDRTQQLPASSISDDVQAMFVGRSRITDIVRDAMVKHGKSLPVFETVENALEAIRVGMMGQSPQSE